MKARAEKAAIAPVTRLDLDRMIVWAAHDVSPQARLLLCFYASHLGVKAIEEGTTAVYPGTERACAFLKVSKESLKRYKRELEKAGYILRRYDNRNQPLIGGAIDLRPLLARREELLGKIDSINAGLKDRRAERRHADQASDMTPRGAGYDPRNGKDKIPSHCSFDLEKGEDAKALAELDRDDTALRRLIADTLDHAPRLREALPEISGHTDPGTALLALNHALPDLFPNDPPRSIANTGMRGLQRLGARLFPAVAIALHDPEVRAASAYLGRLVMKAEHYDETASLKRLAELNPKPVDLPSHGDERIDAFVEAFARQAGREAAASYLAPRMARLVPGACGGVTITLTSRLAHSRLEERYGDALRSAAGGGRVTLVLGTSSARHPADGAGTMARSDRLPGSNLDLADLSGRQAT
jgi:hypothetical protein